jgi:hypothetical protein
MTTSERLARAYVRRWLSRQTRFRGRREADGRATLLTVNYHSTLDTRRLVRSFRRFVSSTWPVVVVENGGLKARVGYPREAHGGEREKVVWGLPNLQHGLGLEVGLRHVTTEFVVICDPDSAIVSDRFWPAVHAIVQAEGICSIDNGATQYHPVMMSFPTALWKTTTLSMEQDWSRGFDAAGQITPVVGGLRPEALLPRTRHAGLAMPSATAGRHHYIGEVYDDVFSNTYSTTRAATAPGELLYGWTRADMLAYHDRWRMWVGALLDGVETLDGFPRQPSR